MITLKQLKSKLEKEFGWENLESDDDNKWFVDNLLKDTIQAIEVIRCCKSLAYEFEKLNEGLKDPEYRQGWIANIAMAQIDCERWYREENNKVGKYLNAKDRHAIANKGAEYFLELLSK